MPDHRNARATFDRAAFGGSPAAYTFSMIRSVRATACLCALPAAAAFAQQMQSEWWDRAGEATSGRSRIKSDLPGNQADGLARHLNFCYDQIHQTIGGLPPRGPEHLHAHFFAEAADYRLTMRTRYGVDAAHGPAVSFSTNEVNGLALSTENLSQRRMECALQHAAFHQFASTRFGDDLPIWIDEGLAMMFGQAAKIDAALTIAEVNPRLLQSVADAIEQQRHVPFAQMLSMSRPQWRDAAESGRAALLNHQAWSMVHFFAYADLNRDGVPDHGQAFQLYLSLINRAFRRDDAFARAFGSFDAEILERQWKTYALSRSPSAFAAAMERIEFLAHGALALHDAGVRPESLDALQGALQRVNFNFEIAAHGFTTSLSANDESLFSLPRDPRLKEQPTFAVAPIDPLTLDYRHRELEERSPAPAQISTVNLPRNMAIHWIRNRHGVVDRYEIIIASR